MINVLVNPAAKAGKSKAIWLGIERLLIERNVDYQVKYSAKPGDLKLLVETLCKEHSAGSQAGDGKQEPLKVIVLGGDGTLNEAVQGITDFSMVQIGYIPTGSSNDLARDLKLDGEAEEILKDILDCEETFPMDVGCLEYNDTGQKRYFCVSAGIGFDAEVCEEAMVSPIKSGLNKLKLGKLAYLIIAVKLLLSMKRCDCRITTGDGKVLEVPNFIFVATMVHQYEGGGFKFCPGADCQDGIMDICSAGNLSRPGIIRALPTAMKGNHYRFKNIDRHAAERLRIDTTEDCWVHTDGEVTRRCSSVTMTCIPGALNLLGIDKKKLNQEK